MIRTGWRRRFRFCYQDFTNPHWNAKEASRGDKRLAWYDCNMQRDWLICCALYTHICNSRSYSYFSPHITSRWWIYMPLSILTSTCFEVIWEPIIQVILFMRLASTLVYVYKSGQGRWRSGAAQLCVFFFFLRSLDEICQGSKLWAVCIVQEISNRTYWTDS